MTVESAREFFESLPGRVSLQGARALESSYRFDIDGAGSWRVAVDDGNVLVEESSAEADCVIQTSEDNFMKLVRGDGNPTMMFMTGKLRVKGDMALALKLRELFF
jgi:putative sterol carrier protein